MITKGDVKVGDTISNGVKSGKIIYTDIYEVEVEWEDSLPVLYKEPWMFNLRMQAGGFYLVKENG